MESEKPRLARLTALITQLQSQSLITARELAERHQVSIRTIYRDIQTLLKSGIPIVTEEGKGYALMDHYRLPPVSFTEEEANAIITAEHLLRHTGDESFSKAYSNASSKIKAILRHSQKTKTDLLNTRIQIRNLGNSPGPDKYSSNNLSILQKCITSYTLLRIDYESLEGKISRRTIEPFALYSTQGNWILIAFCRSRKDWRAFRLDRIRSIKELQDTFTPHLISLQEYFEACRKKYETTPDTPMTPGKDNFAVN
ncbi:MAG: DNA-binding transcriptional regulator [Owenweeksia sp.]|nr:DNA-binding transcriptional regulator [Owenweeksia sp.]MBG00149.1 DNA-binding transcriptional regulator [Owenweeksia sp.]HCQ17567.1 DNA-binding transcriptional regulator [Cryomorphaceae bacterium]|tara:strand:- start:655 stop:1419 length:765 start_codon:yes stop_codon:yes gene_type:complete